MLTDHPTRNSEMSVLRQIIKLQSQQDIESAKKILLNAIEIDPDFFVFHEKLAELFLDLGEIQQARESLERALQLQPEAAWLRGKLLQLGRDESEDVFAGRYLFYPDMTKSRQSEGGLRREGVFKFSRPDEPLVTVVTAVYDNDDSFQRCIDSVRAQTYKNIEYIVIDGGSPASTLDVIKANESDIDYYISEPDGGIYSAMNKGIELANGDYICLLNSDDFYDENFVERAVCAALNENDPELIVYTSYRHGSNQLFAQKINDGLLFGHLNVCHNTFLAHRSCYNRIGPYREDFRIVSDAVWMRDAYLSGEQFKRVEEPLFTLVEGGLSSGSNEAHRKLFISEAIRSYQLNFPFLSNEDAENIYLFRFNKKRVGQLLKIANRYAHDAGFVRALRGYVEHCFRDRSNFQIFRSETEELFGRYCQIIDLLEADVRCIQLETKHGTFLDVLEAVDHIAAMKKKRSRRTILHFITVFSAPSETFVYDLLQRLEAQDHYDNFVLYEHSKLREERPYEKSINIHWADFLPQVARRLYKYIVESLKPDVVIGHFALNEWKWAQRIDDLGFNIPTISMCHGIDAFSMRTNETYRSYLVNSFSIRKNTAFTAVSDYLASELKRHGVPESKIDLVHNTVKPEFFENRKTSEFYDRSRTLKLLSVGRLIQLKGHKFLLDGLAEFCQRCTNDVHLEIVYGNFAEELSDLENQVTKLGLEDNVTLTPFVDFHKQPDYYSKFDCFILPSTYSDDALQRSETFGVAILEAIAAGLPVIATDAGGLPEVIGDRSEFAKIVRHSDSSAIAQALAEFWADGSAFRDNIAYAEDRLNKFSADHQMTLLSQVIDRVTEKPNRVALFSSSTIQGAGHAAYRLHKGLRNTKTSSHLFTTVPNHGAEPDITVVRHPSGDARNWSSLQLPPKTGLTISSLNQTHIPSEQLLRLVEPYDLINLHWHARFLSAENVATLTWSGKPVVMTIRDMLPITGGCHYFHGCSKWKTDCKDCPQINSHFRNFPSEILAAKRAHYNFENLTLVALSRHTRDILNQAPYFKDCRIELIPNSIELDTFKHYDKMRRREELGLPLDRLIIGYVPSFSSEVKGYNEVLSAFDSLQAIAPELNPFVVLVGGETPATSKIKFDKTALGYIHDKRKLAWAYAAADVVVVPSLEETFSNTTAESIACGTPVVGFKTGAIPDLVVNGKTGYTAEIGDFYGLAKGIVDVLRGPSMRNNCEAHAKETLAFMLQAERYDALYTDLLAKAPRPFAQHKTFQVFDEPTITLSHIASESLLRSKVGGW